MSDEVSNFLRSVEQLNHRRDEDEEARSRELEEKLLQQRKERQARREERARSISPQKSSPANTPPPSARRKDSTTSQATETPAVASTSIAHVSATVRTHTPASPSAQAMDLSSRRRSVSPTKETELTLDLDLARSRAGHTSPSSAMPTRTPTLSWQRRPQSQGPDRPKSRPLSMFAAENAAVRSSTPPAEALSPDHTASRTQISQALGSKDPSWFRQTADRGANSAAYRRSQVEDGDIVDVSTASPQLPGMSQSESAEADTARERGPSQATSRLNSPLLPMTDAQKLGPPADIQTSQDKPSSGRASPTRPASPTKGMGGFVQSAMMKRTDSVKRWSVTTPGLQRGNTVSNRNSYDNKSGSTSPAQETTSRPVSRSRDSYSRPSSSHGKDLPPSSSAAAAPPPEETLPASPKPGLSIPEPDIEKTLPTSPSKTMDPRRWSPTKSSWLDAALKQPELPKPKSPAPASNQPAWMVELNRIKAEKAKNPSVDLGRASSAVKKHEVVTGGLVRPAAPGTTVKPPSISGIRSPALGTMPPGNEGPLTPTLRGVGTRMSPAAEKPSSITAVTSPPLNSATSPSLDKETIETPPKKDFKAGLRSRGTTLGNIDKIEMSAGLRSRGSTVGNSDKSEPVNELANVFGNLRKTKTQNYVAPDVFKDNILRGKNGLNITGGPRPYEKKDEFKDAILKKKADFKQAKEEGRGVATNAKPAEEKPLPEGLARRATISRPRSMTNTKESSAESPSQAFSKSSGPGSRPSDISAVSPRTASEGESSKTEEKPEMKAPPKEETRPAPAVAPSPEKSLPGKLPNKMGGALADRFNPALAGLLARGPPGMGGPTSKPSGSATTGAGTEPGPGPQLTHMTRNRARGPRRKAPTTANTAPAVEDAKPASNTSLPAPDIEQPAAKDVETKSISPSPAIVEETKQSPVISPQPPAQSPVISPVEKSQVSSPKRMPDQPPAQSPLVSPVEKSQPSSPKRMPAQVAAFAEKAQLTEAKNAEEPPLTPRKLNMNRLSRFLDQTNQKEPERSPSPVKRPVSVLSQRTKSFEPEKVDPEPAMKADTGASALGASQALSNLQSQEGKHVPEPLNLSAPTTTSVDRSPVTSSPVRSPSKSASDVSLMLKDFFGKERPKRDYHVDAAELLMNRPNGGSTVKTQRVQHFQVTEQGTKVAVASHNERTLYEREMYLCSHVFTNSAGKTLHEVYFWAGDDVDSSIVDEMRPLVTKEAKTINGTFIELSQGKETSEFIQALGGIIIIRRGSSNKYDSLAPNMICGRQFMGQIVFDEVDFSSAMLCSGFPYIITQSGKCYLWKGKGSGVNELSCARLIGMDLALMGELIEVDEGEEPAKFWDLFHGVKKMSSADHWKLKPSYDKYCGRLFRSDAADRRQVIEINSFRQSDLSTSSIYILDAFFEMYIIVGRDSQSQYASFHNALDFAQEYAILAAGMEDRPFVPVSTVVLEGIPRDLRSCFRKWHDEMSPTRIAVPGSSGPPSGGLPSPLKRARSLKIVPLGQALQALGGPE